MNTAILNTTTPQPTASASEAQAAGLPSLTGDFALLQSRALGFVLGRGPFEGQAKPPESGVAFYVNDFALGDPRPWKVPASFEIHDHWGGVAVSGQAAMPEIEWEPVDASNFESVFEGIMSAIGEGWLSKAVPAVTERGVLRGGEMSSLLLAQAPRRDGGWLYGFQDGEFGFAGRTPERFITVGDGGLRTMALAGTARPEAAAAFEEDPKEIEEHAVVVDDLKRVLGAFGEVSVAPREQLDVGGMLHFLANCEVQLDTDAPPELDELLNALHPTPAVGVLPRSTKASEFLAGCRARLATPAYFASPFGVKVDQAFHAVVGIRSVFWEGSRVFLPSGCGILRGSQLDREWRELALKRDWVKRAFSLL